MRLLIDALLSLPPPSGASGVLLQIGQLAEGIPPLVSMPA
jgi:hypothetical protein